MKRQVLDKSVRSTGETISKYRLPSVISHLTQEGPKVFVLFGPGVGLYLLYEYCLYSVICYTCFSP